MATSRDQEGWSDRADAAWAAITAPRRYSRRRKLFGRRRRYRWREYENLWPFSGAWSAACTLASLDDHAGVGAFLPELFVGLGAYHHAGGGALAGSGPVGFESVVVPPLGGGGDVYYDDNAWLGLALVRQHELRHDDLSIALARRLLAYVVSGWSADESWSHPGGIRWAEPASRRGRNACSNAPVAELAALVHRLTGDTEALDWSRRVYDWVRATLLGPDDLYRDHLMPDGTVTARIWTYNQGTMIGAGVLLSEATGDRGYRAQAEATAAASLGRFDLPALLRPNGPAFNAVFFRNLLLLDRYRPDPRRRALAAAYGEEMWHRHRDARTGLFEARGSWLNASAPMVEICALLAGAAPHA